MADAEQEYTLRELCDKNVEDVVSAIKAAEPGSDDAKVKKKAKNIVSTYFLDAVYRKYESKDFWGDCLTLGGTVVAFVSFGVLLASPVVALIPVLSGLMPSSVFCFATMLLGGAAMATGTGYSYLAVKKANALTLPVIADESLGDGGDKRVYEQAQENVDAFINLNADRPQALGALSKEVKEAKTENKNIGKDNLYKLYRNNTIALTTRFMDREHMIEE